MSQPISVQDNAQPAHVARVYFLISAAQTTDKQTNRHFQFCCHLLIYIIYSYIIVQVDMYINNNIIYINIKSSLHLKKCLFVCLS